jgi:hypothetical protein
MSTDMIANHPGTPPKIVAWLGYGGLLPFIALTLASVLDQSHALIWSDALYAYGAIILSFVGALHWGFAMSLPGLSGQQRSAAFLWSVVPALLAWPALLLPPVLAAPLLIAGFIANYLRDRLLGRQTDLPGWYLPLRFRLSSVGCICLGMGVFAW